MLSKIKIAFLGCAIALFFAGCASTGVSQSPKQSAMIKARSEISSLASEPNNIVLMLPLKGDLAVSSQAIRNGFLAAYYHSRKEHPNINIKVVDTTGGDIKELYNKAVTDGAEVIVGPLTKKEVGAVLNINPLPIPTIALNTLDDYTHNFGSNLYQFGLLPQDEATQAADKIIAVQHDRVAIIKPNSAWGDKIAQAFQERYEGAGGQVVATLNYNFKMNLSDQICPFLAQDADKLCGRKKHKTKAEREAERSELMRRQDINAIFLVTSAKEARQIVPLLKFYYAGDLLTYSISAIYSGISSPGLDQDINGIYFCDTPWVLQEPGHFDADLQAIYKQIKTLWSGDFISHPRLYALGVDAYNLAAKLNAFVNTSEVGVEGASGKLYLDNFNHIYRELSWAEIRNGVPVVQ